MSRITYCVSRKFYARLKMMKKLFFLLTLALFFLLLKQVYGCDPSKEIETSLGCVNVDTPTAFVLWFLRFAIGIGGGIAFLLMLFGVFQIITSSGNPERLKAGQETITSAVIGLLMIIFSLFLLRLIGIEILQIFPGS